MKHVLIALVAAGVFEAMTVAAPAQDPTAWKNGTLVTVPPRSACNPTGTLRRWRPTATPSPSTRIRPPGIFWFESRAPTAAAKPPPHGWMSSFGRNEFQDVLRLKWRTSVPFEFVVGIP